MILATLKVIRDLWSRFDDFRRDTIIVFGMAVIVLLCLILMPLPVLTFVVGAGVGVWGVFWLDKTWP